MSINIQPLGDRVLLKELESTEEKIGSIYVPDTAKEKPQQGEVMAIGPGKINEKTGERRPLDVKVGDKVIYAKYSGTEVKHGGQKYILLEQENVLAKLI
jgi:chaperonin GroES